MTTPSTPSPAARFRFRKRYVALTLLAVLVGGYIAWRISITSRIEAELERIRAEGYPASLEELNAWEPPGLVEGNAAEVYLRAFEAMVRDEKLEADVPGLGTGYLEPGEALPEHQRAASEAYLAANNRAIEYLKQAAEIEACKFPQKVSTEFDEGFMKLLMSLRPAARLLHVHALILADRGEGNEAAQSALATLRLGRSLRAQSVLIGRSVSISINLLAVDAVEQVANRCALSNATATMLQREFERAMDRQDVAWGVAGERCYYLDVQSNYAAALMEDAPAGSNPWRVKLKASLWRVVGLKDLDLLHGLRWFELNIDAARSGGDWPVANDFLKTVPNYALTTRMLLTGLGRPGRSEHLHLMGLRTAAAALAAYRYKLDHARWPDTLNALVGQYLTELPVDVYNHNQPLQMKREGEELVIYSFGQNETDDGGDGTELADIVFRLTR